jgi:hypothetical protein
MMADMVFPLAMVCWLLSSGGPVPCLHDIDERPDRNSTNLQEILILALHIPGLWLGETPFFQPLGTDPESASILDEDLQPIALGVAEQEQVSAPQRLTRQTIADETVQPLVNLSEGRPLDCLGSDLAISGVLRALSFQVDAVE